MDTEQDVNASGVDTTTPEQEKMLSQTEVNRIVGQQKQHAAEKARQEAEAQHKAEVEALKAQMGQQPNSMGGMSQNVDDIYQKVFERVQQERQKERQEAEQQRYDAEMQRIASDYHQKMGAGAEMYDDFDTVMKDFDPSAFPRAAYLATLSEATPAVMYELAKNPNKLVTIENYAERDPKGAQAMVQRLVDSIKQNETAKQEAQQQGAAAPLSRMKSSPIGADNGKMTVADYKKADWLRA